MHVGLVAGVPDQGVGGLSNTRCSAMVSSTTPRLGPRCPPVRDTVADQLAADLGGQRRRADRRRAVSGRPDRGRNAARSPGQLTDARGPAGRVARVRTPAAGPPAPAAPAAIRTRFRPARLAAYSEASATCEHLVQGGAVGGQHGAADRHGQPGHRRPRSAGVCTATASSTHPPPDPLGHRQQHGGAVRPGRQVAQQHHELLAAEPADQVLGPGPGPQLGGHRGQHLVAGEVPVARR